MARINLSIPDELKEQMDAFPGENWSRVAQDAFTTKVKINQLKESDMETAGLERLRASKKDNAEREHAEGFELGKKWALERAEYNDLESVAAMSESVGGEWLAQGAAYFVIEAIGENGRDEEVAEFLFGTKSPSEALVEGFIEGAEEVFNEV